MRKWAFISLIILLPQLVFGNEEIVNIYFADIPVMIEIAKCESGLRQFDWRGNALRGGMGSKMVGVFQIHADVHRETADLMGLDIDTLEGNIAYARRLYDKEGTGPWISSSSCWDKNSEESALEAQIRELEAQIADLTEILNVLKQQRERELALLAVL